jgi:hypothetical protein
MGWLVAEFAASLSHSKYDFRKHPTFEEYARGVMASPLAPDFIKQNPELLMRFPPKPLKGLGRGMVWQPERRSRRR